VKETQNQLPCQGPRVPVTDSLTVLTLPVGTCVMPLIGTAQNKQSCAVLDFWSQSMLFGQPLGTVHVVVMTMPTSAS
jgi:hypothetical protein